MKKVILTLGVILFTAVTTMAAKDNTPNRYVFPKFSQGWFIDGAGTYSVFFAHGTTYHLAQNVYGHKFGASGKIGKMISPTMGLRLAYDWHPSNDRHGDFYFKNLHADVMVSPIDVFFGYKPDRFYRMFLYGGAGLMACDRTVKNPFLIGWNSGLEYGFDAGIMNNFRLSKHLDFHIDLQATSTRWSYDDNAMEPSSLWHRSHFDFTAEAGLMIYLGNRGFNTIEPCPESTIVEEGDCSEQETRIKILEARIKELSENNGPSKPCDTIVKFVEVEGQSISYPFSIFFNKGSYDLRDSRDRVNLQEIANVAKKEGYKINLRGTCDSATASSEYNKTLAENRCRKIKDELVKLGVSEKNITMNPVGGVKELTPAELDRRVLINLVK